MLATLRSLFELDDHPLRQTGRVEVAGPAGCDLEELEFTTDKGEAVRGFWCRPARRTGPVAAVLVIHAHGGRYDIGADEVMQGRPALQSPLGPALAARGIASLCLDMPCFGKRAGQGESATAKARLWYGRSLAGQMLGECKTALDWLQANPEVRRDRLGVFGMSMGATLGYWLAGVDHRVRALAQECCIADFRRLVETGAHDRHGIYLSVPGLLNVASNGRIAGMVAPRAQFIGTGGQDPLTPAMALDPALAEVRAAYAKAGGNLVLHHEPTAGHEETTEMRAAMLEFLAAELA